MHKTTRIAKNMFGGNDFTVTSETWVKPSNDNLTVHTTAKINNRDALCVVYNSKSADALAAYSLIHKDLKFCQKILKLAIDFSGGNLNTKDSLYVREEIDPNSDLLHAMMLSFIITYGKCYAQADGRKVSLEAKYIFKDNKLFKEVHDFLIKQRNTYVAHAGQSGLEAAKTIILLDADENLGVIPKLITHSNNIYTFEQSAYEKFLEVILFVEKKLTSMLKTRIEKIKEKELKNISDSHLYELARNNMPLDL